MSRLQDWNVLMEDKDGLFTELVQATSRRTAVTAAKKLVPGAKVRQATTSRMSVLCGGDEAIVEEE
jgi:hypothetical protein